MRRSCTTGFIVLLYCFGWLTPITICQNSPPPLNVELKLVNPALLGLDDRASTYRTGSSGLTFTIGSPGVKEIPVEIVTRPIVINSKARLNSFLSENGIRPDNQALSFVYYLNPEFTSIEDINQAETLKLPVLRIPTIDPLPKAPIVSLTIEPEFKESLRRDVESFKSLIKKKKNNFVPDVVASLESVDTNLNKFYDDKIPSSREALVQVTAEVIALNAMFATYSPKSRSIFRKGPKLILNAEDSQRLEWIKTDLMEKVEAFSRQNPNVIVTVRTLKGENELSNYIVCYASVALYKENECNDSFYKRSSPTAQPVTKARYKFWAIKPGNLTPVSDVRTLPIFQAGVVIDLTIK